MISEEIMKDYQERTYSLHKLFRENILKARNLVVEDSPVDFATHKFICSVYESVIQAKILMKQFFMESILQCFNGEKALYDEKEKKELINEVNSLEKQLASQNEFLEIHTSRNL